MAVGLPHPGSHTQVHFTPPARVPNYLYRISIGCTVYPYTTIPFYILLPVLYFPFYRTTQQPCVAPCSHVVRDYFRTLILLDDYP